jgi:alkylation response protein AidB-like acyl-CoA dehydrogenase
MVAGDRVGAIAMTEPGAGSDLQGIVTRAKLDSSGDYILNGSKVSLSKDRLS